MSTLYTALLYLLTPLLLLRLFWRSLQSPGYRRNWWQRFGFVPSRSGDKPAIWLHLVSVGETLAAVPLVQRLQQDYPDYDIVITSTTPTGHDRVQQAFADTVYHSFAPYDLPDALGRFLARTRPQLAIVMETELWPNTLNACARRGIRVVLANGRLSERSARGYQRGSTIAAAMMANLSAVAAQYPADGDRFVALGLAPEKLRVTGSIKFDIDLSVSVRDQAADLRARWSPGDERTIIVGASTHEGEDALLLETYRRFKAEAPDINVLLVLVPRHPERFTSVAKLAAEQFKVQRHSAGDRIDDSCDVVIGDTLGELMVMLGAADVIFMGGTWVDVGGHNFIEPAAWGKPTFSGRSLRNFATVSQMLVDAGGLILVDTPEELASELVALVRAPDAAATVGAAAKVVADQNRGALDRLLRIVSDQLAN